MTDEPKPIETEDEGRIVNVIVGLFLSCFGIFLVLLGGGCGIMLLSSLGSEGASDMIVFLLLAVGILTGGGFALYHGVRMISGKR